MRRLFSNPLGACAPPQAPNKKYIFGVFGSLIQAIGNQNTTDATNFSNEYQTRITNTANQRINESQLAAQRENWEREQQNFELQRKWNIEDRDYENWYNLPSNVRDRYLQAGINPALAMQGSAGVASSGASTKQANAPSFSAPASAIPMQAAHSIPVDYSGLGLGFSSIDDFIQRQIANERSDRALDNDVEVSRMNAFSNFMNAVSEAKKAGVNEKWINSQIEDAERRYWLDVDRNSVEKEDRARGRAIEERANEIRAFEAETGRMAVRANITLSNAQVSFVAQQISESKQKIFEMSQNGASQRSIDQYIERQQREIAERLARENARSNRQESTEFRKGYADFTDWLFTPLKGIISIK